MDKDRTEKPGSLKEKKKEKKEKKRKNSTDFLIIFSPPKSFPYFLTGIFSLNRSSFPRKAAE